MKSLWRRIRKFSGLKDLSYLGVANFGGSIISSVFWFYLAAIMGPENYGEISYLIAIAGVASVLCLFGSGYTLIIYTAKKENLLPIVTLISIGSSFIAAIVLYLLFKEPSLGIYAIGYVIFNLAIADLLGRKLYKKYSTIFLCQKLLLIILGVTLYYVIGTNGVIIGFGLSMVIFIIPVYQSLKKSKFEITPLKKRLGFSINMYVESLARTFSGQTDKLIIAPLLGFTLLGNYHLGMQFLSLLTILPSIVLQYTLPQDATGDTKKNIKKYTIFASIGFAIISIVLSPIVIPILFPEYTETVILIQIVSLSIIPRTITIMLMSKILGMGKSRYIIIGSAIFLVVQIPLIIILGKIMSIQGVALSLIIADTAQALFLIGVNQKILKSKN